MKLNILVLAVVAAVATILFSAQPVEANCICPQGYVMSNNNCFKCSFGGVYPRCLCPDGTGGFPGTCLSNGKRVLNFVTTKPIC